MEELEREAGDAAARMERKEKEGTGEDNLLQGITYVQPTSKLSRTKTRQNANSRTGEKILEEKT